VKSRAAGFTLIEIVVALALAGLVSLILLQGVRFTATAYDRLARHADRLDDRFSLETLLRHALATAVSLPAIGREAGFTGQPERLSFVTVADDGAAGLFRVELTVAGTPPGGQLILTRRLAVAFADPQLQQSVLARNLRALRLAYFGTVNPADTPEWHDRWEGVAYPPQLVRIILDTAGDDAQPPIVIRLWSAG